MCGIVGYTGERQAAPILLDGLARLEYRGYDSAGIAVRGEEGVTRIVKATGRLEKLAEKTAGGQALPGFCGIGHTRWATHGEPSELNAHPHTSDDGAVIGVHNGIIENYAELKRTLAENGYSFTSDTDTEVAIKLIDHYYKKYGLGPIDAIGRMMARTRGSYALALMFRDYPGEIFAARRDSPMIIGMAEDGACYIASDVPAILKYTRRVWYVGNLQCARIRPGEVCFFDQDGREIEIAPTEIAWDAEAAEKDGYEHFMLKEIHEQPRAVGQTVSSLVKDGRIDLTGTGLSDEELGAVPAVCIAACGSAWHVGMAAQYAIEDLSGVPVRVELASEFRYRAMPLEAGTLVVVISQSGETADSLAALRRAKDMGLKTLAVVNVVGSTIAREADCVLYTRAGPEIAVATTKAYSAQLAALSCFGVRLAELKGRVGPEQAAAYVRALEELPRGIEAILSDKERLKWLAVRFANARDVFFLGRGLDYAVSMEGSLKMKEISYVHSEAYAAGELKHGTISLVEDGVPVIGVLTQKSLVEKTIGNMRECKARGAYLVGIAAEDDGIAGEETDCLITVPGTDPHFMGSLAVVPLQLLGYYTSVARGLDVDKPRNLAKSVTVE